MSLLDKGIEWFNIQRAQYVSEKVTVITASTTRTVDASVIEPESTVNAEGVRVQSDTFTFLFNRSLDLDIKRGVKITRVKNKQQFQVVGTGTSFNDFNDPNLQDIAVPAKICY